LSNEIVYTCVFINPHILIILQILFFLHWLVFKSGNTISGEYDNVLDQNTLIFNTAFDVQYAESMAEHCSGDSWLGFDYTNVI